MLYPQGEYFLLAGGVCGAVAQIFRLRYVFFTDFLVGFLAVGIPVYLLGWGLFLLSGRVVTDCPICLDQKKRRNTAVPVDGTSNVYICNKCGHEFRAEAHSK